MIKEIDLIASVSVKEEPVRKSRWQSPLPLNAKTGFQLRPVYRFSAQENHAGPDSDNRHQRPVDFSHAAGHSAKMAESSSNAVNEFVDEIIHCLLLGK